MQKTGKLELTWVGKYEKRVIEPRILVEDKSKSYGDPTSENMLIHGDNLIALQALQQDFAGKIKCITSTLHTIQAVLLNTMMTALNIVFGSI